jgi:hypothetical protein
MVDAKEIALEGLSRADILFEDMRDAFIAKFGGDACPQDIRDKINELFDEWKLARDAVEALLNPPSAS